MKSSFRGLLYRFVALVFGLVGLAFFLSLAEMAKFYGFPAWFPWAWTGLSCSFLLVMTAWFNTWSWKGYLLSSLAVGMVVVLSYLALRPEMIRDEVLGKIRNPPLTLDLVVYRNGILKSDPERNLKLERLDLIYSMLRTYGYGAKSAL
ncbi:MAG: hypothetical protein H7301_11645 [Cryobacterium sp.]|nr:hypothetical protein [Oligoflexia bacterium]